MVNVGFAVDLVLAVNMQRDSSRESSLIKHCMFATGASLDESNGGVGGFGAG